MDGWWEPGDHAPPLGFGTCHLSFHPMLRFLFAAIQPRLRNVLLSPSLSQITSTHLWLFSQPLPPQGSPQIPAVDLPRGHWELLSRAPVVCSFALRQMFRVLCPTPGCDLSMYRASVFSLCQHLAGDPNWVLIKYLSDE